MAREALLLLGLLLLSASAAASSLPGEVRVLVVLASPSDLYEPSLGRPSPALVDPWYGDHGAEWFREVLAPRLTWYMDSLTYGRVKLEVETTGWLRLPLPLRSPGSISYMDSRDLWVQQALQAAEKRMTAPVDVVVVVDPTSPYDPRFQDVWSRSPGYGWFQPQCRGAMACIVTGTFYGGNGYARDPEGVMVRILAHELAHYLDYRGRGRYTLLDNQGEEFSLMGRAYSGEPLLDPVNEERLLGSRPRSLGRARGEVTLEPRENGQGRSLRFAGDKDYLLEYRLQQIPGAEPRPAVLVWSLGQGAGGETLSLEHRFQGPGEAEVGGLRVRLASMGPGGARVSLASA
ncbi:MAG: hypothetical protein HY558_06565 [Euryarchaeota archaeon]|nr:hypothetical protein [Euryarchaeota archaeon]